MVPVRSYRDLRVWQEAMDLAETTYRATEHFPDHERYGLVTQLRRAAVSVSSNIAEGNARSTGDYLRHLLVSSGSLTEMETQFMLSNRLGFLPPEQSKSLLERCDHVGRMLSSLRKSLRARRARHLIPESRVPSPESRVPKQSLWSG
jgi:four helix bundle protein